MNTIALISLLSLISMLADCSLYSTKAECLSDCSTKCRQAVSRTGESMGWYCQDANKDMPLTRSLVE